MSPAVRSNVDAVLSHQVVVIGGGVAGLSVALGASQGEVALLTKAALGKGGSTPLAQGGIAAALGADDTPSLHAADTLAAAAGLADPEIVGELTREGPFQIRRLVALGARFDRSAAGNLALGREAAHSRHRIVHARGDGTGAELMRALVERTRATPGLGVFEGAFAAELVVEGGRVVGVLAIDADGGVTLHLASAVVLATGGAGRLYSRTTNAPESTGDGLAMAARAGARLADLEFVQFHPTALDVGDDPMPLVTEALRGAGATLVDGHGRSFMEDVDTAGDLAPRDVVARALWLRRGAGEPVFLDGREAVGHEFPERFPTVFAACRAHGIDPRREPIPVAPAAHYHMGGIWVDRWGRTSLPGLWACGETACTGVHGANRLASNSLLEGLVFGGSVARSVHLEARKPVSPKAILARAGDLAASAAGEIVPEQQETATARLREAMWERVGLVREARGLTQALHLVGELQEAVAGETSELTNLLTVARLVTEAALARRESRGSHFRADYPQASTRWQHRLFVQLPGAAARPRILAGAVAPDGEPAVARGAAR